MKLNSLTFSVAFASLCWLIFLFDAITTGSLSNIGIQPRSINSIDALIYYSFIHADIDHIFNNTMSILLLGLIGLLFPFRSFAAAVVASAIAGGIGCWLFGASNSVHIGASGVVYGLTAFCIVASIARKDLLGFGLAILLTVLNTALISDAILGIGADRTISWQAHTFGFIGGGVSAFLFDKNNNKEDE